MRFAVLGSGSKGNALVVDGGGKLILIDAGYSPRELKRRLEHLDVDIRRLDALLLTHGHGDHIKGAKQLAGALNIPTYCTEETKRFCHGFGGLRNVVPIASGRGFEVGGLSVLPVATPHDAPGSVCFVVDDGEERLGHCTDLGVPTEAVASALSTCHALVVEHNHDVEMLRTGPYSAALKRRIAGPRGHLSNEDGARLLAMSFSTNLTRVLLAHLSEVNNTPDLALRAARKVIDDASIEVAIAPQHHPTGWLKVNRKRVAAKVPAVVDAIVVEKAALRAGDRPPPHQERGAPQAPLKHAAMERQLALFATSKSSTSSSRNR